MNEFDRINCIDNITWEVKSQGKKLGEIEVNAGGSPGILSRLRNNEGKGNFSVELFHGISQQLRRSMDYLANYNPDAPITENDKYLLKFLDQLTYDTEHHNTAWDMLDASIVNPKYIFEHPLFSKVLQTSVDPLGLSSAKEDIMQYNSRFDETAEIAGHCYFAGIRGSQGTSVHIMKCRYREKNNKFGQMTDAVYEMYFIGRKKEVSPLVSSHLVCTEVATAIKDLYFAIEGTRSNIRLNDHTMSVIEAYMNRMGTLHRTNKEED